MLEGSSGYSKGILVTGSIKKKEATTYTPGVNNITITKGQYLNGDQIILGDVDLKPENIKSGLEIFGISGTYTSEATATSNKILEGETCYVNGEKLEGNLPNKSGLTIEASEVKSDSEYIYLTIPESGYYDTNSKISLKNDNINSNIGGSFYYLGTGTNFNLTALFPNQYQNFTADNFVINYKGISGTKSNMGRNDKADVANYSVIETTNPSKNYNKDTGIFTIGNMIVRGGWENEKYGYKPVQVSIAYDVYLIIT